MGLQSTYLSSHTNNQIPPSLTVHEVVEKPMRQAKSDHVDKTGMQVHRTGEEHSIPPTADVRLNDYTTLFADFPVYTGCTDLWPSLHSRSQSVKVLSKSRRSI